MPQLRALASTRAGELLMRGIEGVPLVPLPAAVLPRYVRDVLLPMAAVHPVLSGRLVVNVATEMEELVDSPLPLEEEEAAPRPARKSGAGADSECGLGLGQEEWQMAFDDAASALSLDTWVSSLGSLGAGAGAGAGAGGMADESDIARLEDVMEEEEEEAEAQAGSGAAGDGDGAAAGEDQPGWFDSGSLPISGTAADDARDLDAAGDSDGESEEGASFLAAAARTQTVELVPATALYVALTLAESHHVLMPLLWRTSGRRLLRFTSPMANAQLLRGKLVSAVGCGSSGLSAAAARVTREALRLVLDSAAEWKAAGRNDVAQRQFEATVQELLPRNLAIVFGSSTFGQMVHPFLATYGAVLLARGLKSAPALAQLSSGESPGQSLPPSQALIPVVEEPSLKAAVGLATRFEGLDLEPTNRLARMLLLWGDESKCREVPAAAVFDRERGMSLHQLNGLAAEAAARAAAAMAPEYFDSSLSDLSAEESALLWRRPVGDARACADGVCRRLASRLRLEGLGFLYGSRSVNKPLELLRNATKCSAAALEAACKPLLDGVPEELVAAAHAAPCGWLGALCAGAAAWALRTNTVGEAVLVGLGPRRELEGVWRRPAAASLGGASKPGTALSALALFYELLSVCTEAQLGATMEPEQWLAQWPQVVLTAWHVVRTAPDDADTAASKLGKTTLRLLREVIDMSARRSSQYTDAAGVVHELRWKDDAIDPTVLAPVAPLLAWLPAHCPLLHGDEVPERLRGVEGEEGEQEGEEDAARFPLAPWAPPSSSTDPLLPPSRAATTSAASARWERMRSFAHPFVAFMMPSRTRSGDENWLPRATLLAACPPLAPALLHAQMWRSCGPDELTEARRAFVVSGSLLKSVLALVLRARGGALSSVGKSTTAALQELLRALADGRGCAAAVWEAALSGLEPDSGVWASLRAGALAGRLARWLKGSVPFREAADRIQLLVPTSALPAVEAGGAGAEEGAADAQAPEQYRLVTWRRFLDLDPTGCQRRDGQQPYGFASLFVAQAALAHLDNASSLLPVLPGATLPPMPPPPVLARKVRLARESGHRRLLDTAREAVKRVELDLWDASLGALQVSWTLPLAARGQLWARLFRGVLRSRFGTATSSVATEEAKLYAWLTCTALDGGLGAAARAGRGAAAHDAITRRRSDLASRVLAQRREPRLWMAAQACLASLTAGASKLLASATRRGYMEELKRARGERAAEALPPLFPATQGVTPCVELRAPGLGHWRALGAWMFEVAQQKDWMRELDCAAVEQAVAPELTPLQVATQLRSVLLRAYPEVAIAEAAASLGLEVAPFPDTPHGATARGNWLSHCLGSELGRPVCGGGLHPLARLIYFLAYSTKGQSVPTDAAVEALLGGDLHGFLATLVGTLRAPWARLVVGSGSASESGEGDEEDDHAGSTRAGGAGSGAGGADADVGEGQGAAAEALQALVRFPPLSAVAPSRMADAVRATASLPASVEGAAAAGSATHGVAGSWRVLLLRLVPMLAATDSDSEAGRAVWGTLYWYARTHGDNRGSAKAALEALPKVQRAFHRAAVRALPQLLAAACELHAEPRADAKQHASAVKLLHELLELASSEFRAQVARADKRVARAASGSMSSGGGAGATSAAVERAEQEAAVERQRARGWLCDLLRPLAARAGPWVAGLKLAVPDVPAALAAAEREAALLGLWTAPRSEFAVEFARGGVEAWHAECSAKWLKTKHSVWGSASRRRELLARVLHAHRLWDAVRGLATTLLSQRTGLDHGMDALVPEYMAVDTFSHTVREAASRAATMSSGRWDTPLWRILPERGSDGLGTGAGAGVGSSGVSGSGGSSSSGPAPLAGSVVDLLNRREVLRLETVVPTLVSPEVLAAHPALVALQPLHTRNRGLETCELSVADMCALPLPRAVQASAAFHVMCASMALAAVEDSPGLLVRRGVTVEHVARRLALVRPGSGGAGGGGGRAGSEASGPSAGTPSGARMLSRTPSSDSGFLVDGDALAGLAPVEALARLLLAPGARGGLVSRRAALALRQFAEVNVLNRKSGLEAGASTMSSQLLGLVARWVEAYERGGYAAFDSRKNRVPLSTSESMVRVKLAFVQAVLAGEVVPVGAQRTLLSAPEEVAGAGAGAGAGESKDDAGAEDGDGDAEADAEEGGDYVGASVGGRPAGTHERCLWLLVAANVLKVAQCELQSSRFVSDELRETLLRTWQGLMACEEVSLYVQELYKAAEAGQFAKPPTRSQRQAHERMVAAATALGVSEMM